ncbi:hypothetical protein ACLOJK_031619 [Asimina triloba]
MAAEISERISLFRSQLKSRRLDYGTLSILESVVASKDVKSLLEVRAVLSDLLRAESVSILREIGARSPGQKLSVVEFLVNAFAIVADIESCLALRYEALLLREAVYGYEHALGCMQSMSIEDPKPSSFCPLMEEVERIKKQRDKARILVASDSVQAQTAEYSNRKAHQRNYGFDACASVSSHPASSMFRIGIKKRNMQFLHRSRSLPDDINRS